MLSVIGCGLPELAEQNYRESVALRDQAQEQSDWMDWLAWQLHDAQDRLGPEQQATMQPLVDAADQMAQAQKSAAKRSNTHVATAAELNGRAQQIGDFTSLFSGLVGGPITYKPGGRPLPDPNGGTDWAPIVGAGFGMLGASGLLGLRRRKSDPVLHTSTSPPPGSNGTHSPSGRYPAPPQQAQARA